MVHDNKLHRIMIHDTELHSKWCSMKASIYFVIIMKLLQHGSKQSQIATLNGFTEPVEQ